MNHKTNVVEVSHVSDTMLSVRLRCCEDATTDSCHTIEVSTDHTDDQIKQWLDSRHSHVQELHNRREKTKAIIAGLK